MLFIEITLKLTIILLLNMKTNKSTCALSIWQTNHNKNVSRADQSGSTLKIKGELSDAKYRQYEGEKRT